MNALTSTYDAVTRRILEVGSAPIRVDLVVAILVVVLLIEWDLVRAHTESRLRLRPFGAPSLSLLIAFAIFVTSRWLALR
jgi:hypothetical protein